MKSFAEAHPELLSEWAPENKLDPKQISYGSNKKVIWQGACGHQWEAIIKNRGNGHGCPICSSNRIVPGLNDLESQYSQIAEEWSHINFPAQPFQFGAKSNRLFWWVCPACSREWKARIADRTDGHGCPYCLKDSIATRIKEREESKRQNRLAHQRQKRLVQSLRDESFRYAALCYYAEETGFDVETNQDCNIGIPLQVFFPQKCAAIELTSHLNEGWKDWRYENAKNWLCLNAGITLIRIIPQKEKKFENCKCVRLKDESVEALNYTLRQVFKRLRIPMDIDVSRDFEKIRRCKVC